MKKKEEKKKKQKEKDKNKKDEEKEDKEWKKGNKEKNIKDGKEVDLEKSNNPTLYKRSKNKDTLKPDLTVIIKAARIERQRVKMLKQQLLLEIKWLKLTENNWRYIQWYWCQKCWYTQEYLSSEESLSSNSEEEKTSSNIKQLCSITKRDMYWEMQIVYLPL